MQTFLPYPNFSNSAACLDDKRLGKQRVEVLQILRSLTDETIGWKNHPAVLMWKGFEPALATYGLAVCHEWTFSRKFKDTCLFKITEFLNNHHSVEMPPWLGNKDFHDSHKSNLLRKNPEWYGQFYWNVPSDLPYVWPSKLEILK